MARHHHHRHHRYHRRHNPFGIGRGVLADSAMNAGGALASLYISNLFPTFTAGWMGVGATGVSALALSYGLGAFGVSPHVKEEVLKGGITATIIKALHQAGIASNIGLGLYAPSWFGVPTASSQYLQASQANLGPYRRGAGTIFFPGPGGALVAAPPAAAAGGMGFHRFRSRYAGTY
jgi:hypothetical protein